MAVGPIGGTLLNATTYSIISQPRKRPKEIPGRCKKIEDTNLNMNLPWVATFLGNFINVSDEKEMMLARFSSVFTKNSFVTNVEIAKDARGYQLNTWRIITPGIEKVPAVVAEVGANFANLSAIESVTYIGPASFGEKETFNIYGLILLNGNRIIVDEVSVKPLIS